MCVSECLHFNMGVNNLALQHTKAYKETHVVGHDDDDVATTLPARKEQTIIRRTTTGGWRLEEVAGKSAHSLERKAFQFNAF